MMISRHVRRVDQLDAFSLDNELFALLNVQYRKVISYIPSYMIAKNGSELDLLFRFLFKYLPLKYLGSTFGQNVLDLKYFDDYKLSPAPLNVLRLLAVIDICFPWIWDRVLRKLCLKILYRDRSPPPENFSYLESRLIIIWKLISLVNFCIFLQKSTYSTVTERVLRIRPLYASQPEIKLLQYDGIMRELLWHGLSEFLGFTLPLINMYRIKNYFHRLWFSLNDNNRSKYRFLNTNCLICGHLPNFPHSIGCTHVFCYYCISSMLLADPHFTCMFCKLPANGINCIKAVPINRPDGKGTQKL